MEEEKQKPICKFCNGKGWTFFRETDCPKCFGLGVVLTQEEFEKKQRKSFFKYP